MIQSKTRKCGNCDAWQLEAARRPTVVLRLIYEVHTKFEVRQSIVS